MDVFPLVFRFILPVVVFSTGLVLPLSARPLQVEAVEFRKLTHSDYLCIRVRLVSGANPLPEVVNPRFLDDVSMRILLGFRVGRDGFAFFESRVRMVTLEQGVRYQVEFFLPEVVMRRSSLNEQPFAYLLEFQVSGYPLPFDRAFASRNIADSEEVRQSFIDRVSREGRVNMGVLLPSYLAPHHLSMESARNHPAFFRNETEHKEVLP